MMGFSEYLIDAVDGTLVALTPLVAGLARTLLLRRQARPIDDGQSTRLLDDLRRRLALSRRVGVVNCTKNAVRKTGRSH